MGQRIVETKIERTDTFVIISVFNPESCMYVLRVTVEHAVAKACAGELDKLISAAVLQSTL